MGYYGKMVDLWYGGETKTRTFVCIFYRMLHVPKRLNSSYSPDVLGIWDLQRRVRVMASKDLL